MARDCHLSRQQGPGPLPRQLVSQWEATALPHPTSKTGAPLLLSPSQVVLLGMG